MRIEAPREGLTEDEQTRLTAWEAKPGAVGEWERGMLWGMRLRANAQDADRIQRLQSRVKEARARKKPKPRARRKFEQQQEPDWYDFAFPEDR